MPVSTSDHEGRARGAATALATAVCLALLAALIVAPSASAQSGELPRLGIKTSRDAVVWDKRGTRIGGTLRTPAGVRSAGRLVKLYERPYPYRRSKIIARTRTNDKGRYSFGSIKPDYNSRYRAAVNEPGVVARSDSPLVAVYVQADFDVRATRRGTAESRLEYRYSPKLPTRLDDRRILWYFNKVGASKAKVRDRTRTNVKKKGVMRASSSFRLPPGRYRFEVRSCIKITKKDIGIGPPVARRGCPETIRLRSGRAQARADAVAGSGFSDVATARRR
jgi:hypothetical protein